MALVARARSLSTSQKEVLVNGFIEVPTQAGDAVINQGEYGNHFYMVDTGRFDVYLQQAGEAPVLSCTPLPAPHGRSPSPLTAAGCAHRA